ncbi:MAG: hypothetical protein AB7N24_23990 [Dehalococcoidia bacterium]
MIVVDLLVAQAAVIAARLPTLMRVTIFIDKALANALKGLPICCRISAEHRIDVRRVADQVRGKVVATFVSAVLVKVEVAHF